MNFIKNNVIIKKIDWFQKKELQKLKHTEAHAVIKFAIAKKGCFFVFICHDFLSKTA